MISIKNNAPAQRSWGVRLLLWGGLIALVGYVLFLIQSIITPLVIALVLGYLLNPLVNWMERQRIQRALSILLIYLGFIITLSIVLWILIPIIFREILSFQTKVPLYISQSQSWIAQWQATLAEKAPMLKNVDLLKSAGSFSSQSLLQGINQIPVLLMNVLSIFSLLVLVPFLMFFILKDGPAFKKSFLRMMPNRYFEMTANLLYQVDKKLSSYLRGQIMVAGIFGLLVFIGLSVLGVPYAFFIAVIAGLTNLIPYVGPFIGLALAAALAFLDSGNVVQVLQVAGVLMTVQLIDNMATSPIVMSKSIELHPMVIFFSLMIGGSLFGFLGMLLAVPITASLEIILKEIIREVRGHFVA